MLEETDSLNLTRASEIPVVCLSVAYGFYGTLTPVGW